MKRLLFLLLMACTMLCACHRNSKTADPVVLDRILNVDELTSSDNADMTAKFGDYTWYETQVLVKNYLDAEYDGVEEVTNVFQVATKDSDNYDVKVIVYNHTLTKDNTYEINGFWFGDFPLEEVEVSYEASVALFYAVNDVKPHSKHITLRREIGPINCNAQWIYGNVQMQRYVDAVTGKYSENSPAFPLGQRKWPQ